MKSHSESYKAAGVDITAGYKAVELMKEHIAKTMSAGVMGDIGGAAPDCTHPSATPLTMEAIFSGKFLPTAI